jgi:hypothetical protein
LASLERVFRSGRRDRPDRVAPFMGRQGGEAEAKTIKLEEWEQKLAGVTVRKEDMNKLVMNFLVTEGYVEAAQIFERESRTTPDVDLGAITDRTDIRKAVQEGDLETAIARVNDLSPEILEGQVELCFHLQQQQLIELIRAGSVEEALDFAATYLAPIGEENPVLLHELERTLALLAFPDASKSPVADLMDPSHRQKTASKLNAAILKLQNQEQEPRLPNLLKMIIWSQQQLDEKMTYPRVNDLVTAELTSPT